MAQPTVFCASCLKIFNLRNGDDLLSPEAYKLRCHHSHLGSFLKAVHLGCFVCTTIQKYANEDYRKVYSYNLQLSMHVRFYVPNKEADMMRLETQHSSSASSQVHYMVFYLTLADGYGKSKVDDQSMSHTSDPSTLGLAYQWYLGCRACHKDCKELPTESRWYPKRLVNVGIQGDELWRLIETSTERLQSPNYMTLSYRWGSSSSAKLTESNINAFKDGSSILDLPQTFQDAILVSRRFSITYLWIDSLCIVQDSKVDWETEASSMAYVYANSACNITATASTEPNGGLFRIRKLADTQPGIVREAHLNPKSNFYYIFEAHYWHRQVQDMPLHRRGWVLQERLLARRVLHFAQNQIFWECRTLEKCEAFPLGMPVHHDITEGFPPGATVDRILNNLGRQLGRHGLPQSKGGNSSLQAFNVWNQIIKNYSRCDLTVPTDKLVALSGLACALHDFTGDEYVAGFWKSNLIEYLDWRVYAPRAKPLSQCRAPSWSWASIDGPINPCGNRYNDLYMIKLLEVEVRTLNSRPFGQVLEGGFILVRGILIDTSFHRRTDNLHQTCWLEMNGKNVSAQVYEDTLDERLQDGKPICCLALKCYPVYSGEFFHNIALMGLLLERITYAKTTFRRVGHFTLEGESDIEVFGISNVQQRKFNLDQYVTGSSAIKIF